MYRNLLILAGYVGNDPELRTTGGGVKVVNLRLATGYSYKDRKTGEQAQHTTWHNLVFYDWLADIAMGYAKGDNIYAEGMLLSREWTPNDGHKRTVMELRVERTAKLERVTQDSQPGEDDAPPADGEPGDGKWPA